MAFNLFSGGDTSTSATTSHSEQSASSVTTSGTVGGNLYATPFNSQGSTGQTINMVDVGATSKALDAALQAEQILATNVQTVTGAQAGLTQSTLATLADQSNRQTQALADIKAPDTTQQRNLIIGAVCIVAALAVLNMGAKK